MKNMATIKTDEWDIGNLLIYEGPKPGEFFNLFYYNKDGRISYNNIQHFSTTFNTKIKPGSVLLILNIEIMQPQNIIRFEFLLDEKIIYALDDESGFNYITGHLKKIPI